VPQQRQSPSAARQFCQDVASAHFESPVDADMRVAALMPLSPPLPASPWLPSSRGRGADRAEPFAGAVRCEHYSPVRVPGDVAPRRCVAAHDDARRDNMPTAAMSQPHATPRGTPRAPRHATPILLLMMRSAAPATRAMSIPTPEAAFRPPQPRQRRRHAAARHRRRDAAAR